MQDLEPKRFQYVLAFLGLFLFIICLQLSEWFHNNGHDYIRLLFIGYYLGFLLSFSLLLSLEILKGNINRFVDSNIFLKPISYLCLFIICIFSALGFWSTNYTTINYGYNTAFFIGTLFCGFGLIPVISYYDNQINCKNK